jgi:hypothetical protein
MWAIISAVILFAAGQATCVDVDFYSDATIDNGDVYDNVFVYDTPPDQTTVDMWGGTIGAALPHDSSTFNMYGGQIHAGMGLSDWSTVNIYDGTLQGTFWVMDSAWLNIYGGDVSLNSPMLSESSTVNIFGYDFAYDGWELTGFLSDHSAFSITEMTGDDYSHMNLVVIPEPSSLALLALGALLAKRRC